MTSPELLDAGTSFAQEHNTDVLLYCGPIYDRNDVRLISEVAARRSRTNLLLILTTEGGSPDAAYRIVRCLQERYASRGSRISVLINGYCKSAGTLMALVAHELVMTELAELGPLDIQTLERDEIAEYSSGLKPIEALQGARCEAANIYEEIFGNLRLRSGFRFPTKLAAQVATDLAVGLASELYKQIDPLRLAETTRAMRIMEEYALRIQSSNVKDDTIARLIASYPDHGFVIDRREAKTLFERVRLPTPHELQLSSLIERSDDIAARTRNGEATIAFLCSQPEAPVAEAKPTADAPASDTTTGACHETAITTDGKRAGTIEPEDREVVGGGGEGDLLPQPRSSENGRTPLSSEPVAELE